MELLRLGTDVHRKNGPGGAGVVHTVMATRHPDLDAGALVAALVEAGADINRQDRGGCTPLAYAAQFGSAALISALLAAGADVAAQTITLELL